MSILKCDFCHFVEQMCPECGRPQMNAYRLEDHINASHKETYVYSCPNEECGYICKWNRSMVVHMREHHGDDRGMKGVFESTDGGII